MDNAQQVQAIRARLDDLDGMPVTDDQSARDALTHAMVTVNHINQLSARTQAEALTSAGPLMDGVLGELRTWLDRLVAALTKIVENLAKAASFTISVGTGVSVAVNFGPFGSNSP